MNLPFIFEDIYSIIFTRVEQTPDTIAIEAPGWQPLSYADLLHHIQKIMATLRAVGIGHQDRVAIVLPNGPEMAIISLAVAAAATSAPLNPAYQIQEFEFYLSDLNIKLLIMQANVESPARTVAKKMGIPVLDLTLADQAKDGLFHLAGVGYSSKSVGNVYSTFAKPEDIALVLHTSGTTARPKIVPLTHRNLCTAVHYVCRSLELSAHDRCLNMMPQFHIGGLVDFLLSPLSAGGCIICTSGFNITQFINLLEQFRPTWYQAVPATLYELLSYAKLNQIDTIKSSLRFIRSVAAPLSPQMMIELETLFKVPVIETYGMTEAAPLITSNPLPPGQRKHGSVGLSVGPEVAIMDKAGHFLPRGDIGEVVIRGDNVIGGYEKNQEANVQTFIHGWFRTGDQGYIDKDGYLFLKGRLKEIINRGGEKISPQEIDKILLEHPAVVQALTFAIPHKVLGEDIAALVVLREGQNITIEELLGFLTKRLSTFKVPRDIHFVTDIPKGPTGKLQRIGLAEKLGIGTTDYPTTKDAFVKPRNPMELALTNTWSELLGVYPIGIHDNFFELGGSSLAAVELFSKLSEEFSIDLPLATLYITPTVEKLSKLIEDTIREQKRIKDISISNRTTAAVLSDNWKYLVPIQPNGRRPPFFCIHAVGGNVINFYVFASVLGQDQPVYGLQSWGLTGTEDPPLNIEAMATEYIHEIRTVQPFGPYYLGGASMGGLIALEVAQQLTRIGEEVDYLAMFDTSCPIDTMAIKFRTGASTFTRLLKRHISVLRSMSLREQFSYTIPRLKTRIGNGTKISMCKVYRLMKHPIPHQLRYFYVEKNNIMIALKYKPKPFRGQLTLFSDSTDKENTDLRKGWHLIFEDRIEIVKIPAKHNKFIEEPILAKELCKSLVKAQKMKRKKL